MLGVIKSEQSTPKVRAKMPAKTAKKPPLPADDETVEIAELGESLGFLLRIAQLRAFEAFFDELSALGLRPGEFTALWLVLRNPGMKQGAIARSLCIKPAHMTKLVDRLVTAGLMERVASPEDRRAVHLSLTPEGETFAAARKDDFLALHQAERGNLSEAEFSDLTRLLKKYSGLD